MNTNNLDNNTATPLYLQLKNKLQEDIENGRLAPGSKIPTEFELGEQYGVSRVTVRKALKELSDQGYLERKSGKGTFVAEKKLQRSLSSGVLAFSEMCRSMGLTPGAQTIKIALEDPTEKDTERMHLTPDEKIMVVERIRTADGKPVVLELNKFPESFSFLFGEDLNNSSLYEILNEKHGIILDHSCKVIDIVFANAREAKALGISKGYPLLRINSVITDSEETFVNLCTQLCIGDKFKFTI